MMKFVEIIVNMNIAEVRLLLIFKLKHHLIEYRLHTCLTP